MIFFKHDNIHFKHLQESFLVKLAGSQWIWWLFYVKLTLSDKCPDNWSNMISRCDCMFLNRLAFVSANWERISVLTKVVRPFWAWIEQKGEGTVNSLLELSYPSLPVLRQSSWFLGLQNPRPIPVPTQTPSLYLILRTWASGWKLYQGLYLFSECQIATQSHHSLSWFFILLIMYYGTAQPP
jgi:hypothetical protein